MKKFVLVPMFLLSLGFTLSYLKSAIAETYTYQPKGFSSPVIIENVSKTIMFLGKEVIYEHNNKIFCLNKVLFWDFTSGFVGCGLRSGASVYHVIHKNLHESMYFTLDEIYR